MMKSPRYLFSSVIFITLTFVANATVVDFVTEPAGREFLTQEERGASVLSSGNYKLNEIDHNMENHPSSPKIQENFNQHFSDGKLIKISEPEEQELDSLTDKKTPIIPDVPKFDLKFKLPEEITFPANVPIDVQKRSTTSLKAIVEAFIEALEHNNLEKLLEHVAPGHTMFRYQGVLVPYDYGVLGTIGEQLDDRLIKIAKYYAHDYSDDVSVPRQITLDLSVPDTVTGSGKRPRFWAQFSINHEHKVTMLQVRVVEDKSKVWKLIMDQFRSFRDNNP